MRAAERPEPRPGDPPSPARGPTARRLRSLLLAAALVGCDAVAPSPRGEAAPPQEPVVEVRTTRLQRGEIRQRVTAPGSLLARRESRIGAEMMGRVQEVFVRAGDRVEAGTPLFRIDPEPYAVALRQSEAGRDLARSERRQIESDVKRLEALHGQHVVAEEELDRMRTRLAVARARERQAQEAVALARHNLERTLVVAPYSGSIAERLVDEGTTALVQPQTVVVVLQETAELEAQAQIPESERAVVRVGDPALVHVEGLGEPLRCEVIAVGDTIDPGARTYRVRMRVPNPDHRLKAGIFARVEIHPAARRDVLLLPREAIRTEEARTRVLVVREGRAQAVEVQLGVVSEEHAEVISGIAADSEVIVGESAQEIAPGMRVRVVESSQASAS